MWGSQETKIGEKVDENFSRVDQGKKNKKREKKYYFPGLSCEMIMEKSLVKAILFFFHMQLGGP